MPPSTDSEMRKRFDQLAGGRFGRFDWEQMVGGLAAACDDRSKSARVERRRVGGCDFAGDARASRPSAALTPSEVSPRAARRGGC